MREVYVVYKTDELHSYASRDIIGIATTVIKARNLCKRQARKEGDKITSAQGFNLRTIWQTQGYSGKGEFQIEALHINVLL